MLSFSARCGRISVDLTALEMGNDLCVLISGGDRPHLGAVAVAQARPSKREPSKLSAITSTIVLLGHQEDEIAKKAAQKLLPRQGEMW